ncbi:MAG: CHAT domain-containing protein, partial [Bacteroidota bacterium]
MRVRFGFLALLLFPALALPGQAIPDSLFRADQRMLDTAKTMSQDSAFQFLAPYLAQRYRSGNWTQSLAEGYHKIASDLQRIGNNLTGLSYVDTALTIRPTLPDTKHLQFARSYFVKGALLTQLNAYHLATEWSERAVAELNTGFAAGEQHADLEIMLGYFHQHSGRVALLNYDFDLAERRLAQAETILETYPDDWTAFDVLVDRGNMNVRKENFPTAITAYEEVFRLAAASEDQLYVRIALFNLALSHSQLGNRTEANRLFDELRGDFREIPPQERDLQYYSFLGNFYGESLKHQLRTGRFRDTEALLQDGLEAFRYEFPTGLGGARGELLTAAAQVADQKGNAVRADSLLRAAFASLVDGYNPSGQKFLPILADRTIYGQRELLFALATARDLSREESTEAGLLDAMAASYTIDTLLQRFREQFNLTGSFGHFLRQQRHHYVTAVDIALQLYRRTGKPEYLTTAYGFVATEKGNLLRRYLTSPGLARSFGVPDDLLQRQRNLELTILALESAVVNKEETITLRDSLLRLNTELQLLKTDLKTNYPAFTRALQGYAPIDPINIQRQLADDQQLIEFFLTPDSVYAFTLTSATGLGVRVLPRPRDLEALISGTVRGSPEAASGYDQLLADILEPGLRRVQLIPDGELWALPFQALRLPDGRFLIEEYAISYAYASSLLFDETQRKTAVAELENFRGFGIDYTDLVGRLTASGNRS